MVGYFVGGCTFPFQGFLNPGSLFRGFTAVTLTPCLFVVVMAFEEIGLFESVDQRRACDFWIAGKIQGLG